MMLRVRVREVGEGRRVRTSAEAVRRVLSSMLSDQSESPMYSRVAVFSTRVVAIRVKRSYASREAAARKSARARVCEVRMPWLSDEGGRSPCLRARRWAPSSQ